MNINLGVASYDVLIKRDLIEDVINFLPESTVAYRVLIVTDSYLEKLYADQLKQSLENAGCLVDMHVMQAGKINKTFNEALKIYGILEINNYARDSYLIALGGGVIGDLAGFVASTWYRGMNLIHMPTTLMAMVDSSIGGKVAINYRETINAVGNYYHPVANFMDVKFIETLPEREYISGLAEVIKCGMIRDTSFLQYLNEKYTQILNRNEEYVLECVKRAIEIKVEHVNGDITEGGKRLLLNYGHTIGHAIEMATQNEEGELFRHGEGVALGMSAVLHLSEVVLGMDKFQIDNMRSLIAKYNLPINFSASEYGYERVKLIKKAKKLMFKDKKRKQGSLRFILLEELGKANVFTQISDDVIEQALMNTILN